MYRTWSDLKNSTGWCWTFSTWLLEQQTLEPGCGEDEGRRAEDDQVGHVDQDRRADHAGREAPQQVDAVIERRQLHNHLQWPRVDGDGIERGGEQKQGNQNGQDEVEILPGADERRSRGSDRGEREANQHGGRQREQRPG